MAIVYFIITPQVGFGSIQNFTGKQMYCVKFGDSTKTLAERRDAYRTANPSFTMVGNDVGDTKIGNVAVGTWLKRQIFVNQGYVGVPEQGVDKDGEWFRSFDLDGQLIAALTTGGQFAGFNFTTGVGQNAALNALLAIFTTRNAT